MGKVGPERPWMALADTLVGDDGERFERAIEEAFPSVAADSQRPWPPLKASLSQEAGDSLAAAIEEMFPIER